MREFWMKLSRIPAVPNTKEPSEGPGLEEGQGRGMTRMVNN